MKMIQHNSPLDRYCKCAPYTKKTLDILQIKLDKDKALEYIEVAIRILKNEGPKLSTQMDFGKTEKGKWGHGKLAGATLDYLFHKGIVGVSQKKGTQKVYDLIENLIPESILSARNPFSNLKDFHKWLLVRRIGSIGLYWNTSNAVWQGIDKEFNSKRYREILYPGFLTLNTDGRSIHR